MTNKEIREIIEIFQESGVAEMEVQRGESRLRLRRDATDQDAPAVVTVPHPAAAAPQIKTGPAVPDPDVTVAKSPIVGTYFDAPAPGASPFVKVGDRVEAGQTLCIIESMKLMNEIEAEVSGVVMAKLVENGRPVEYGEALFSIRR